MLRASTYCEANILITLQMRLFHNSDFTKRCLKFLIKQVTFFWLWRAVGGSTTRKSFYPQNRSQIKGHFACLKNSAVCPCNENVYLETWRTWKRSLLLFPEHMPRNFNNSFRYTIIQLSLHQPACILNEKAKPKRSELNSTSQCQSRARSGRIIICLSAYRANCFHSLHKKFSCSRAQVQTNNRHS